MAHRQRVRMVVVVDRLLQPDRDAVLVAPGGERGAGRRAHARVRIALRQPHAPGRERVDPWRRVVAPPVAAEVAIAEVVGHDEHHVGQGARVGRAPPGPKPGRSRPARAACRRARAPRRRAAARGGRSSIAVTATPKPLRRGAKLPGAAPLANAPLRADETLYRAILRGRGPEGGYRPAGSAMNAMIAPIVASGCSSINQWPELGMLSPPTSVAAKRDLVGRTPCRTTSRRRSRGPASPSLPCGEERLVVDRVLAERRELGECACIAPGRA